MKHLKNEDGFTLAELTVVLAVVGIFVAAMSSLLMYAFEIHAEITADTKEYEGKVLMFQHIERVAKSNDRREGFLLADNPLNPTVNDKGALCIKTGTDAAGNSVYVYYYLNPDTGEMYIENGTSIYESNPKMKVGSGIEDVEWQIGGKWIKCVLTIKPQDGGNARREELKIALKTEQTADS